MSVYQKLFEIQQMNLVMTPDAENPFFHSKYVSIQNIMNTLKPILQEKKLLLYHVVNGASVVTFLIDTELEYGKPEGQIISQFPLSQEGNAQQKGAEVTYGKRYNISAMFALIEEDDDGNTASGITEAHKQGYTPIPTKSNGFQGKNAPAERWLSEKEVDDLFKDMVAGKKSYGTSDQIVKEYRSKGVGVSKKLAAYISESFVKYMDIPF